jgi:predicted RNase H-like nuclease
MTGKPCEHRKKHPLGAKERRTLLGQELIGLEALPKIRGVKEDDLLDACAAAWSARRFALGKATTLPASPTRDERGLLQRIVV